MIVLLGVISIVYWGRECEENVSCKCVYNEGVFECNEFLKTTKI